MCQSCSIYKTVEAKKADEKIIMDFLSGNSDVTKESLVAFNRYCEYLNSMGSSRWFVPKLFKLRFVGNTVKGCICCSKSKANPNRAGMCRGCEEKFESRELRSVSEILM